MISCTDLNLLNDQTTGEYESVSVVYVRTISVFVARPSRQNRVLTNDTKKIIKVFDNFLRFTISFRIHWQWKLKQIIIELIVVIL